MWSWYRCSPVAEIPRDEGTILAVKTYLIFTPYGEKAAKTIAEVHLHLDLAKVGLI